MSSKLIYIFIITMAIIGGSAEANAQKRRVKGQQPPDKPVAVIAETPTMSEPQKSVEPIPAKKNSRGGAAPIVLVRETGAFTHFYEFSRPEFTVNRIVIRHDDKGKGDIRFSKTGSEEAITDPLQLSSLTLERIATILGGLDFLNSTENYQYAKDYSHLGNIKFTQKVGEKSRTVTYNWTENKGAKALMDEYRRIGQQYVWMFDVNVARENQPLEAPKLMETLDGYIRRGDISDPEQMITFLNALSDDERIPLIARNHAAKLVKQIERDVDKAKK